MSDKFSFEEIIHYAAITERRGADLYTRAANGLNSEPARNILLHLAGQERQHEQTFIKLKDEVSISNYKSDTLDDEAIGYLGALVKSEIFPSDDKEFVERFKTLKDVINVGKQAEKDSILFYAELSRHAWDQNAANTLRSILNEEKRHLVQLQELDRLIEERDIYY